MLVPNVFGMLLVVAAMCSVLFAGLAWRRRSHPGAVPLAVFHFAMAVGVSAYALDIVSTTLSTQILAAKLWLICQAFAATTWAYVAIEYTGLLRWTDRRTLALFWLEPVGFAVVLVVPRLQRWLFSFSGSGTVGSIVHAGVQTRPLWFVHYGVLFAITMSGTFLFVQLFLHSRHLYRTQATAVVIAAIVPWVTVLAESLGLAPGTRDPSVLAWAASGMALTAGLYRFKTLDPVPAARRAIVDRMGDGVVVVDEDGNVGDINPAARRLLAPGTDETDLVGRRVETLFEEWSRLARETDDTSDWQELELTVEGEQRFVEAQVSPFRDRFDRLIGHLVVLRDITARKRREQTLERYKTIFDAVREPAYVLDEEGRFTMANDPMTSLLGCDRGELLGAPFEERLADASDAEKLTEGNDGSAVDPTGDPTEAVETAIVTATGERVPAETRVTPVTFEEETTGFVGFVRDISRRKAVEETLRETEERFETLVESSPLAIVAADTDWTVEAWNPAAERMFGWRADEVVGHALPTVPEDQKERIQPRHERVLAGERLTGVETTLERKDGSRVEASVSIAPIHDAGGDVTGSVSIIADITERKERERELRRTNERLDEFASIVSHDLRNPLDVAGGNLEFATTTADPQQREDAIETAQDALDRMERIIDKTLTLARQGEDIDELVPVPFRRTLTRAWANTVTGGADLEIESLPDSIEGDPTRVTTLLENLFANAIEHGARDRPSEQVTVRLGTIPGGFFVADNGPGVPDEDREQVFESGYSTAKSGTGFGLSIVETVAEAHGWSVAVTESDAGGARFEFTGVTTVESTGVN